MPLADGATFAGYTILRLLGSGGMGEVYLAQHPRLPRDDALKVLPLDVSADTEFRDRFAREADLAAKLWHPHIVGVHDRGEFEGQIWISMDFVDGTDAARLLADRYPAGLPPAHAVQIIAAVASALDYAHKRGMLHRDVKPANIMVAHGDDEGEQRILLSDFGIARNIDDISGLTATNMTIGTVAYCAPEQLMGEDLDGRADQYALAATAYHLLSGSQLFPHSNPAVVIGRHLNANPPALADTRPELAALDPVLGVALAKNPADRFTRCADFAQAVAEQVSPHQTHSPVAPTRPAPVGQPLKTPSAKPSPPRAGRPEPTSTATLRSWVIPAAAAAAVLLVGFGAALVWTQRDTSSPAQQNSASTTTSAAPDVPTIATSPPTTAPPTTTPPPSITDVDPAEYAFESPGLYRWVYATSPVHRECGISFLDYQDTEPGGVSCEVSFPPGTPEVALAGSFIEGPPNLVVISPPNGPENSITEGGGPGEKTLPPNHRITVGPYSCTALPGGGIDCSAPSGGFRFADGVLTKRTGPD